MDRNSSATLRAALASVATLLLLAGRSRAAEPPRNPRVISSSRNRISAPLRDFRVAGPVVPAAPRQIRNDVPAPKRSTAPGGDRVVQRHAAGNPLPELSQFEGGADSDNDAIGGRIVPPDTDGDVGPNHYFQYLNLFFTIYDKSGNLVFGPAPGNAFWAGLGTACETQNDGDTIVQYDQLADRWLVSQFALPNFPDGPFHQCVAVSATGDPTGVYYQYDFVYSDTLLNDYPKFGVWPDAYYMTANEFRAPFLTPVGAGAVAFDRNAMLAGLPATAVQFEILGEGGLLPSDLDGLTPPPAGSPNFFLTFDTDPPRLSEWRFHVDFATPAASTLTGPIAIPVSAFDVPVCGAPREACIPQQGSNELLEDLGGRVMYRLAYRNFGDHESLVTNFTVNAAAPGSQAAIRWCEVRDPNGAPALFQEGTYAPDSSHRFMGSIAMDAVGNVALGYSKSDDTIHPSLAVAGRLASDTPGTLGAEDVFLAGTGSQTDSFSRWGDYSAMAVDPADDCTFWFTGEYYQATGSFDWHTRVASFRFPNCTTGPTGILEGTVTDGTNAIPGATVTAGVLATTTDGAGHYQFHLPVGAYDMTASKFGFEPGAAAGVVVSDGGDTVQDFSLAAAPSVLVNGVVSDGSGGGWPLYARIDVSAPGGFPGATVFTDPVTGYYAVTLVGGAVYQFAVGAVTPGYAPVAATVSTGGARPSGPGPVVANFGLTADLQSCAAPGYFGPAQSDFSAGILPVGWSLKFSGSPWQILSGPDPCGGYDGNLTGGSGPFAVVSFCEHAISDTQLRTPTIDLSRAASARIQWSNDYADLNSIADVDISTNGGIHWTNVWERSGADERGPGVQTVDISELAAGRPSVQARFRYVTFFSLWWQVDDVFLGEPGSTCQARPGGLVVGTVRDANTGAPLVGATVTHLPHQAVARTLATPDDPNQDDGLFVVFADSGSQTLEAEQAKYTPEDASVVVIPNGTVRLDFSLAAGRLAAAPRPIDARALPGESVQRVLTLSNSGSSAAGFSIGEVDLPLLSSPSSPGPFAPKERLQRNLARLRPAGRSGAPFDAHSAADLPPLAGSGVELPTLPAGRVVGSFPTGIAYGWGVAYDTDANDFWLSNINAGGGDNRDYRYLPDGTRTGDTIDEHAAVSIFAADGTYNPRTKTLWRVDAVGLGSSCVFEADPATKLVTGNTICPETGTSERGLAYDDTTDTYYIGSWNDGAIKHFSPAGEILDSAVVNETISGLAFNPSTRHLFAMLNIPDQGHNVVVYDVAHQYAVVGAFPITDDSGADVLETGAGAGLDADCEGNLWLVDQNHQLIYQAVSGERGWCPTDIAWLSEEPSSGVVPPVGSTPVTLTLGSGGLFAGLHQAQLQFLTDTPYALAPVGIDFTVRFLDVVEDDPAGTDPFERFIYGAAGAQIMPGCDQNGFLFCPADAAIRADMAAYVWRSVHGPFVSPPVYRGIFVDVNPFDRNADYIQGVFDDGITAGCQVSPPKFCPNQTIPRAQMAVFIEKAMRGAAFVPPPCTGYFGDVSCPPTPEDPYGDWVELLSQDGITAGCSAPGDPPEFCPLQAIPNEQLAVFLVRAFGIPYLP